jgi:hypothetical protein
MPRVKGGGQKKHRLSLYLLKPQIKLRDAVEEKGAL